MPNYLAIYLGTASPEAKARAPVDPATERAGMAEWGRWAERHEDAIMDQGTPLGRTKRVDGDGISDTRNELTGYVIVRAGSLAEAAAIFTDHPHFSVFPGDRVEIIECLDMPR